MFAQLTLLARGVRRARVRRDTPVSEYPSRKNFNKYLFGLDSDTPVPDVALFPLGALRLALIRVNAPEKRKEN